MRGLGYLQIAAYWGLQASALACGTASGVLSPRIPHHELAAVRALANPLPATPAVVEKGRELYHGKGFCVACHGLEGRGITDVDTSVLKGALPTDFTKVEWQAARTDGELMWVLKNGSPGTAMASFVPVVLTEEDAWQVIRYLRSFVRP